MIAAAHTPHTGSGPDPSPDAPPAPPEEHVGEELETLRVEIEALDQALIDGIAHRVELARRVGALKQSLGLPVLDPRREAAVVRNAAASAREAGLAEEDTRAIFWQLVGLCRRAQI